VYNTPIAVRKAGHPKYETRRRVLQEVEMHQDAKRFRDGAGALVAAGCLVVAACTSRPAEPADLLIRHARVYTADAARPWAEAIAIRGERIAWVGDDPDAASWRGERTRVIDVGGRLVLPGFIDSHNHIMFGSDPDIVTLYDAASFEDLRGRVRAFAAGRPDLAWIEGEGWNYSVLPGGRRPTAGDLEGLTGGRPAFLVSYDAHTVWLNREAVRRLGLGRKTDRLPYGEVEHDPKSGEPTGFLTSFATLGLSVEGRRALREVLPSYSDARRYQRLRINLEHAASYGITTIVEPQAFLEDLPVFERARREGILGPRLQVALFHPRGTTEADLDAFEAARRRYDDDRLRVAAIKLYIDDVIEPHTAALLEPYADRPDTRGDTLYPPAEFADVVTRIDRRDWQIFIHAIGDRGIRTALDAIERARRTNGARDARHELVHIECLSPQDAPRFKALGVVACMQPRHCAPEIALRWSQAIGPGRWDYAWAFRTLKEAGAVLAFASDWNVAEMEPAIGIYEALTRAGLDGRPAGPWGKGQTVDLETAIRAYTIQGAWANFQEKNRGSIEAGKYADLVVLSDDLFKMPPERIPKTRVLLTLVGGKATHRSADFAAP
jgi:predicted amidohydrolase YtcJ